MWKNKHFFITQNKKLYLLYNLIYLISYLYTIRPVYIRRVRGRRGVPLRSVCPEFCSLIYRKQSHYHITNVMRSNPRILLKWFFNSFVVRNLWMLYYTLRCHLRCEGFYYLLFFVNMICEHGRTPTHYIKIRCIISQLSLRLLLDTRLLSVWKEFDLILPS